MHYITGTYFTIAPQRLPISSGNKSGNLLPQGQTYQLFYIKKTDEGVEYSFIDNNRKLHKVAFKSTRDADAFISLHRREKLPDYDALKIEVEEPIN